MDRDSGEVSKSAMERFGAANGVEVCIMKWLSRLRPSGQYALVVIKVAMKENVEKLLRFDDGSGRVLHMRLHAFPAYISRFPLYGLCSNHVGLRRYRPISRPIFLVVRFHRFIHSFQHHSVHQDWIA